MFTRSQLSTLLTAAEQFPVVVVTGPRQSGKTTLIKLAFPNHTYINLESPDDRARMLDDPQSILRSSPQGLIIDEAQNVPELFSYIQVISDEQKIPGQFILSGSQNFALSGSVSQSLAGRAITLELLPLSYRELCSDNTHSNIPLWEILHKGLYPRPHNEKIDSNWWYQSYIQNYLERDVRSLFNIQNLNQFQTFLKLCAGRHGQLLNLSQLANDCGITHTTANNWISILEASYICIRLQPYHKNYNKRLVKTPKLYFLDSAIVCALLSIESAEHLASHEIRGAIFEGFILSEAFKKYANKALRPHLYFWRDHTGNEIDLLIEKGEQLIAGEIKSSSTYQPHFLKGLKRWQKMTEQNQNYLIYSGDDSYETQGVHVINWKQIENELPI